MRARSREINIFNMSLLDILCGALGAFCFMMLVLLPYYKPPGKETDLHNQEVKTQELLNELEKLRARVQDSAAAQQMTQLAQALQGQVKQMQGQLNQLSAENQQLENQNKSLAAENDHQARQLEMRRPFLVTSLAYPSQELDIYLDSDTVGENEHSNPRFDPTKAHQSRFFTGDIAMFSAEHGFANWLVRDAPLSSHYKLYVKVPPPTGGLHSSATITVASAAFGDDWDLKLPNVTLSPERFWTLVGTFSLTPERKPTFQEATQAEREAEWSKLSKSSPPPQARPTATTAPATPFPVQTAHPTETPLSPEQRRALLEKSEKERRERQQHQSPSPGMSPSQSP
jgi:hypothetical protein